jgi:hypothetical protein
VIARATDEAALAMTALGLTAPEVVGQQWVMARHRKHNAGLGAWLLELKLTSARRALEDGEPLLNPACH